MLTHRSARPPSLFAALRPMFTPWDLWHGVPRRWQGAQGVARLLLGLGYVLCGMLDLLRYVLAVAVVVLTMVLALFIGVAYVAVMIVATFAMGILGLNYYAPDGGYCGPGSRRGVF